MTKSNPHNKLCPNCETSYINSFSFCPNCGQANKNLSLNFKYFVSEFLSGMFNLDSKIYRTLKLLFLEPGKLSKEFIAGKRNSYIPPVRMYLIGSLIYFTISSFFNDPVTFSDEIKGDADTTSNIIILNTLDTLQTIVPEIDTLKALGSDDSFLSKNFGKERLQKINTKEGRKQFRENIMQYIPIGMFFLVPLTALLFFLLFYKNTYYIEHLIFVIHLQTLFYLIFTILNLLETFIDPSIIEAITAVVFVFILLIWVKKFYVVKWLKAIGKSVLFLLMYSVIYFVFFLIIAAISFFIL